jgi:hypothetical protein
MSQYDYPLMSLSHNQLSLGWDLRWRASAEHFEDCRVALGARLKARGQIMLSVAIAAVRENNAPLVKGRQPTKFTPHNVARIKEWVAKGVGRDEIANRLGVTVGSLQVTCSRLGISLRKSSSAKGNGAIQPLGVVQRSTEHIQQADDPVQAKLRLLIQSKNRQAASDLPLSPDLLVQLALEASVRGQTIPDLIGNIVRRMLQQDLVGQILRSGNSSR